jgi:hypothetical protein
VPDRRFAALLALVPLALPVPGLPHTRLQGQFTMTGRITSARDVPGEYVGELVTRSWTFVAPCPAGQCATEKLVRSRAAGRDAITLKRKGGVFDQWVGKGSFYAPLQCGARIYRRGERVWFTIAVGISGVAAVNGMPVATTVTARYSDYKRTNQTRCVAALGHDAAVYTGTLVNPPVYP